MTAPLTPDRLALLRAADLLEKVGWRQGARMLGRPDDRLCILEALTAAIVSDEFYNDARQRLTAHFGIDPLFWNDEPGRTQEQAVAGVRAAAITDL